MRKNNFSLAYAFIMLLMMISPLAFAGGPLIINPATKKPVTYPGTVHVYYDLGNLATGLWNWNVDPAVQVSLDNNVGKHLVEKGYADWSNIPSTSFRAVVVGDFSQLGLPDITGANAGLVIGTFNGGGVQVIFDADGTVMSDFFGASPNILGISSPEFGEDGTNNITESWTVLGGQAISADDTDAANYQGVATHEFGHSINLAHTQTNGGAYFFGPWGELPGPASCGGALPYPANVTSADVETMYPFANPAPGGTGLGAANIHTTDDIAAISELYPGPGWPNSFGTITGTILDVDGKTPLTGVNVIARNISDPYNDANSTLSGEWTQGMFGPDGSYTLRGLKPGAQYVVYVDSILAGGFPTPPMWFLPGPEKFYNGPPQKGEVKVFTSCQYKAIAGAAGKVVTADIKFDRMKGAPLLYNLGPGSGVSGLSGDGSIAVGTYGRGAPIFRWTAKTGVQSMGVLASWYPTTISNNGQYISSNIVDANDTDLGAFRWDAKNGWKSVGQQGSCDSVATANFATANDGSVFGLAYVGDCTNYHGFRWNPATGLTMLPSVTTKPDGTPANSRVNRVSADGSVAVGWEESTARVTIPDYGPVEWGPSWVANSWNHGQPNIVRDAIGDTLAESNAVSGDGTVITGTLFVGQAPFGSGWLKRQGSNDLEYFGPLNDGSTTETRALALSKDGSVIAGLAGSPFFDWTPGPFIKTPQMGMVDLNEFAKRQGVTLESVETLWSPEAMSDDGSVLAGWSFGKGAYVGWVLQIPKAFVCHVPPTDPNAAHTISVAFPGTFDQHLAHGDTPGPCQDYQP